MKRINFLLVVTLALAGLGLLGSRGLSAQDNLKNGKVLQRTALKGAPGWEAILVERILPAGAESGKHTQSGNEIVYVQEGSIVFEAQGKPAVTLQPGEAFTTSAGEVHNVKNASSSSPAKALAFYVAKRALVSKTSRPRPSREDRKTDDKQMMWRRSWQLAVGSWDALGHSQRRPLNSPATLCPAQTPNSPVWLESI